METQRIGDSEPGAPFVVIIVFLSRANAKSDISSAQRTLISACEGVAWRVDGTALAPSASARGRSLTPGPREQEERARFQPAESRPNSPEPVGRGSTARPADTGADEFGLIRRWLTAILCAAEDPERVRNWGGRVIAVRLVLLALGQAAMVSGSSTIEFGTRNLAVANI